MSAAPPPAASPSAATRSAEPSPAAADPAAASRPGNGSRTAGLLGGTAWRLIAPAVLLLLWWLCSRHETWGLFIAPPQDVFPRFFQDFLSTRPSRLFLGEVAWDHLLPSLGRALLGFLLALVTGVVIGVALGIWPVMAALCEPLIHLGRSLPTPALLGVFFFLFGTGDWPKILLIAFGVVWPILFNTIDGVHSIGAVRAQVVEVFKIPARRALVRVVLAGASPKIFAGARIALSLSLILMIISELQKSKNGLGYLLVTTQRNFDYVAFWTILVTLAVVGVVLNVVLIRIERRTLAWHRGESSQHD
ncbi:ABC transporter permease [Actinomadura macra]|uniref:ABC transporter permease n=1 Tax=Actinomadura macra TaxID=46164 RepID=UPI000A7F2E47|nr:ABC transporter permease subunit [Actinomadura macra]